MQAGQVGGGGGERGDLAENFGQLAIQVADLRARFEERTAAMQRQLDRVERRVERLEYVLWGAVVLLVGQIVVPLLARRWGL